MRIAQAVLAAVVRLIAGARPIVDDGYAGPHPPEAPRAAVATVLDLPEQAVYFANHSSHLDFVTVWAVLPGTRRRRVRPVAAADYWGGGWKGRATAALFRPVLVERGRGRGRGEDAEAGAGRTGRVEPAGPAVRGLHGQLATLGAVLEEGDSLLLFPEGTRGDGHEIARFQAGLARLARAFPEVPIIPVALANLGRILPKGGTVPVPLLGTAAFLPPLAIDGDESEAEFLERARTVLAEALPDPELEIDAELDERSASAVAAEPASEASGAGGPGTGPGAEPDAGVATDAGAATDPDPDPDPDEAETA